MPGRGAIPGRRGAIPGRAGIPGRGGNPGRGGTPGRATGVPPATARIGRFGQVSSLTFARERNLLLEPDLVTDTNDLAFRAIVGMLNEGERSEAARADATGARNIRLAADLRKALKQKTARRVIAPRDAHEIAAETRESFRRAINGKLVLPPSIARLAA